MQSKKELIEMADTIRVLNDGAVFIMPGTSVRWRVDKANRQIKCLNAGSLKGQPDLKNKVEEIFEALGWTVQLNKEVL